GGAITMYRHRVDHGVRSETIMIRHLIGASVLALLFAAPLADTASARGPFDGSWSVLIVTNRGACDRAYRYGVQIVNGRVMYGGGGVNMSGYVSPGGAVHVTVSAGGQSASGSGRLRRNS